MKIISWNINGIRAAWKKGFLDWLRTSRADIVCLQETKAHPNQLPFFLTKPNQHQVFFSSANKKGYSGTAVYTKAQPISVETKFAHPRFAQEGRFIKLKYTQFSLINLYLPHGGRDKHNLDYKLEALHSLFTYLKKLKERNIILTGDFNIAHSELDLAKAKENQNQIKFTPQERKELDQLENLGFTDTFRYLYPQKRAYTWWLKAYQAKKRNIGWRIDYIWLSKNLLPRLKKAFILKEVEISDHCPIGINLTD